MSPDHDVTISLHFSGTPHPQHRAKILEAFAVLLDSLYEQSADSAHLAFNVDGSAECRLFHEKGSWIGYPTSAPVPPQEGD